MGSQAYSNPQLKDHERSLFDLIRRAERLCTHMKRLQRQELLNDSNSQQSPRQPRVRLVAAIPPLPTWEERQEQRLQHVAEAELGWSRAHSQQQVG